MIPLTLEEVAAVTGGRLADGADPRRTVAGPVAVDSREVAAGALFVAVAGERVDGHDFAAAALDAGAVAILAARPVGVPAVVVPDTVGALGRLARAVADRLPAARITGITGSSGKTSTKDLVGQLLANLGPTVAAAGSYNNEIGVPLTVCRAEATTRHLVLELGARGVGHIARLAAMAPPRIGVVLNVGTAHVGEFGSRDVIARAKAELVESLPADATAVLNADDDLVAAMAARTSARVVTFGLSETADVRAEDVELDASGRPTFRLVTPQGSAPVRLRLYGEHNVSNALAAASVAAACGMTVDDIAAALAEARAQSRWRMEVTERADGVTVVNDAYNANPDSVRAALKALVGMARGRRTWAVLGEMLELGDASRDEHDAIGRLAVRLDVSRLVVVGQGARPMHLGAGLEGSWGKESIFVPEAPDAVELLRTQLRSGDVVLVKASRAAGLERVAQALLAEGGRGPGRGAGEQR